MSFRKHDQKNKLTLVCEKTCGCPVVNLQFISREASAFLFGGCWPVCRRLLLSVISFKAKHVKEKWILHHQSHRPNSQCNASLDFFDMVVTGGVRANQSTQQILRYCSFKMLEIFFPVQRMSSHMVARTPSSVIRFISSAGKIVPGNAFHKKSVQRRKGIVQLVGSHEQRALLAPLLNRW